jgi:hypothetical protein
LRLWARSAADVGGSASERADQRNQQIGDDLAVNVHPSVTPEHPVARAIEPVFATADTRHGALEQRERPLAIEVQARGR